MVVSFSIVRNWYRLTSRSDDSFSHSMRHINTLRFLIFSIINMGHNILYAQPRTAMVIERKYSEIMSMIIANGSHIVTTFFVISALMVFLSLVPKLEKTDRKLGIVDIVMMSVERYIRLTPAYAFVLLLEATWVARYLGGPLWRKGFETSRTYCRRHWWANLLYINNYYATDEPCMQHTWYLAADFHMFVYAAALVYMNGYEAVTVLPPEPLRFFFWYWDMYHETYLPTHMNLVNYTTAIMGSFYILHLHKKKFHPTKMFSMLWILGFCAIPGSFIAGYLIYSNVFHKPSIWMAVYFPLGRIFYTLLLLLFIIGCTFRTIEPIARLLNIHIFGILGRLSYCAYLGHFFITRAFWFNSSRFTDLGIVEMTASCLSTLLMSYCFAAFLSLVLESPFLALRKIIFEGLHGKFKTSAIAKGRMQATTESVYSTTSIKL
ncbi:nose resistant to fluoxetine protein 6-like [Anopheles cruzii]|uniref:nose resistant to fluoxetine protein 6-like n=1 Tax=Anopheles cruzii TaxID=68878 RepID=UPI0022EC2D0D|nr:nose resistant to fluoxetine protein 6-like [Anopheles cruzii]